MEPRPATAGDGLAKLAPSADLMRLHRRSLTHLLLVGGTAANRVCLALAFHRASPLRRTSVCSPLA